MNMPLTDHMLVLFNIQLSLASELHQAATASLHPVSVICILQIHVLNRKLKKKTENQL